MNDSILRFKTIAVATDLGDPSSAALRYAQTMARMYQSTLVVVHVIDPLAYAFPGGAPSFLAANQSAVVELRKIQEECVVLGIPVRSVVESGVVCDRILEALKEHHADLLVLGTRTRTAAGRAALGTVARQLLTRSRCPILTVSPDAGNKLPWACCWGRVLAATDFSPASIRAIRCAHQLALRQLIVLHAPGCLRESGCANCQEKLRFLAPFNESHTVPVEHIVAAGDAAERIVEYARKFAVDLVVLGSPEGELTEEDLYTSTVLQVIANIGCPVLCLNLPADTSATWKKTEVALTSGFSL